MSTDEHAFERYARRTGHYPRFRRTGFTLYVHPSYLRIRILSRDVYIPRQTAVELLRWLVPLVKRMTDGLDPDGAMSEYLEQEHQIEEAIRAMKGEDRRRRRILRKARI